MEYYFITGTSSGIGKSITEKILARENTFVTGISRSNTISNDRYKHCVVDLSDIDDLIQNSETLFSVSDIPDRLVLINNAGLLGEVDHVGSVSNKSIADLFKVNLIAPAILSNTFIHKFSSANCRKTIINISSGAGKRAVDGWAAYCASKAGLDMFSQVIALEQNKEHADFKIFSVAPGVVDTKMQDQVRLANPEGFSRWSEFVSYKKEGKLSNPDEVADKYIYLLDHENQFSEVLSSVRDF